MTSRQLEPAFAPSPAERLSNCVEGVGSAAHPYARSHALLRSLQSSRNLADAVYCLCAVHGRRPGVIDHATQGPLAPAARDWLEAALEGFSAERAFLARLAVEAGPVPSTPGAASAQSALLSQRHALEMLASSERNGCALGAAMALVLDWGTIRWVLNTAAGRFNVPVPDYRLNDDLSLLALADRIGQEPLVERAMLFGAQQIMLQHHGLWDLLEARQSARDGAARPVTAG